MLLVLTRPPSEQSVPALPRPAAGRGQRSPLLRPCPEAGDRNPWESGAGSPRKPTTLSSDFPAICPGGILNCTPLHGIEAAHTRQESGNPSAPVVPPADERLTVEQAIRAYTIDNAYQMRMENELGSIEPGKLADLVVLEENLFEIEKHEIHKIQVLLTMMNGKIVFDVLE